MVAECNVPDKYITVPILAVLTIGTVVPVPKVSSAAKPNDYKPINLPAIITSLVPELI